MWLIWSNSFCTFILKCKRFSLVGPSLKIIFLRWFFANPRKGAKIVAGSEPKGFILTRMKSACRLRWMINVDSLYRVGNDHYTQGVGGQNTT